MTGAAPSTPSDARRRFQTTAAPSTLHPGLRPQSDSVSESPFRGATQQHMSREYRALDEHSFIQNTESRLDDFLAQGQEVLNNLVDQRNMLKGTQKRLLDAANTMGLSRDVIGWIERRRYVVDHHIRRCFLANSNTQHTRYLHLPCGCRFHVLLLLADMALFGLMFLYLSRLSVAIHTPLMTGHLLCHMSAIPRSR